MINKFHMLVLNAIIICENTKLQDDATVPVIGKLPLEEIATFKDYSRQQSERILARWKDSCFYRMYFCAKSIHLYRAYSVSITY